MIPRLRPPFSLKELLRASISRSHNAVKRFEIKLAEKLEFPYGLFFPYGRSALYTLLKTLEWKNEEVVLPAYICVVVPNAVLLSGNRVKFVDSELDHFNVSAERLSSALSSSTKMIIPTPLNGFPIDRRGYEEAIVQKAPQAFVLFDIAQAFGIDDEDGLQTRNADGAFVGLGRGKMISSVEGGMLLLRDKAIYRQVKAYRKEFFEPSGLFRGIEMFALGAATCLALREPFLSIVDYLENKSSLLNRYGGEIPVENGPFLPANVNEMPSGFQAELGLLQISAYDEKIKQRREMSFRYEKMLMEAGFTLFQWSTTPTFSQFPVMVKDQVQVVAAMRQFGVQVRSIIPYACSDLPGYESHKGKCPSAALHAERLIVLPNWYGITASEVDRVVEALKRCRDRVPEIFLEP